MTNYKLIAETALLAGEIMLRSGAETYRVEDTIRRILNISEPDKAESFVAGTGIVVTIDAKEIDAITMVKTVDYRNTNLYRIAKVNDISRRLCLREIEFEYAFSELRRIKEEVIYKRLIIHLSTIGTATFFCAVIGGGLWDCTCAAINGIGLVLISMISNKLKLRKFISDMISSFFIAIIAVLLFSIFESKVNQEFIIIGSIMPLLPGVAFTNAIRDTLQGDYMSGVSRAMEAFVIALSIGFGIGTGLSFCYMLMRFI